MRLQDDPAFLSNGRSVIGGALGLLSAPFSTVIPAKEESRETEAAELLTRLIRVRRIGISFIIVLDVRSHDAALSARLNNALVEAFIAAGLEAKNANSTRASVWLQQRLADLRTQAAQADRAVQDFKAEARIVDTDKGLMDQQRLGELTSQIVLARARVADASARLDRVRQVILHDQAGEGLSDELDNQVIIHLREQYVDAANQVAQWAAKVGPDNAVVKQMNVKLQDLRVQIKSELDRIAQGTESDYRVALANQSDIERQLDELVAAADRTNVNLVRLRELQSAADNYKALYADFLQRYTEAVQNESFPISNIRIVTRATPPLRPSWPLAPPLLCAALAVGIVVGIVIAIVLESLDRGIRTAAQIRAGLGLPCLAMLPILKGLAPARMRRTRQAEANSATMETRLIEVPALWRRVILEPLSPFAEAIRGLRFKLTHGSAGRRDIAVIGCVSASSGEGKSTVAANFAVFLASAGFRTLLLDWDLRRQSLSQILTPGRQAGYADVVNGGVALEAAMWRDAATGLAFLPAATTRATGLAGRVRGPEAVLSGFGALLGTLRQNFDYIVVDLPAMLPIVDAAVAAQLVDGMIVVVEWGKTPLDTVRDSISQSQIDAGRILGVVLNKVDLHKLADYPTTTQVPGPSPLVPA
jgi:succinoglycan biosynthesis transport protein ExoP